MCKRKFSTMHFSMSGSHTRERTGSNVEKKRNSISPQLEEQDSSLLAKGMAGEDKGALYMTPYSNVLISHPISVWVGGLVGLVLFGLAFASLFVHPEKLTCDVIDTSLLLDDV